MLGINLEMAGVVHRVLHSRVYDKTGRLPGLLPWAFGVSLCFSAMVLAFARRGHWVQHLRRVLATTILVNAIPLLLPRILRLRQPAARLNTIAFFYAGFLLCLVLLAVWYAVANARRASPRSVRTWILVLAVVIYAGTTGWMKIIRGVTGDEPHYLLLAHSLAHDHDFDLSNNYGNKDYRAFYPYDLLPDNTVPGRNGTMLLFHDIGLPVLLMPGYALGGHTGAMLTVNILTALLGLGVFEAALGLGADVAPAILAWAAFTFSAPLIIYASQIYPETAGAAAALWAVVLFAKFMRYERERWLWWAGVLLALLPWLCIRYWMLAGPLMCVIGLFIVRSNNRAGAIRRLLALALPLGISMLLFGWFDLRHFGTILPNAGYLQIVVKHPQYTHTRPIQGMLGLLFDRLEGIIPIAPIYICALAGIIIVARRSPWLVAALSAGSLSYLVFMSFSQYWTGGWCPPARYSLASAILLAPAAAFALQKPVQRWFFALALLWSIFPALCYTAVPEVRYPYRPDLSTSSLDLLVRRWLGFDFDVAFPSMIRSTRMDYYVGAAWFCAVGFCLWILCRRRPESNSIPSNV